MTVSTPAEQDKQDSVDLGGLYEHDSRPDWGLATRVAHDGLRYAYQFEDGRLRKVAASHDQFMKAVERPFEQGERMRRQLAAMGGTTLARRSLRGSGSELISLDQQLQIFESDFPEGFAGAAWIERHRDGGGSAKRHREPAIARAHELLDETGLAELLAEERHDAVIDRISRLLASTGLLTVRQRAPLSQLGEDATRRGAEAIFSLLHEKAEVALAMRRWVEALASAGAGVSWVLATAVPALMYPDAHFCVRESVFWLQTRWLAPRMVPHRMPSGPGYLRLREVAGALRAELTERGHTPRDFLDVYDFVWWTLRPASQRRIAEMSRVGKAAEGA
jgi:hypothetical protein